MKMGSHQGEQFYSIDLDGTSEYFEKCWKHTFNGTYELAALQEDLDYVYSDFEANILGLIVAFMSITGTILNAFVIFALLRNQEIRKEYITPSIISIAITDLLFCVLCLPVHSLSFFKHDMPINCKLFFAMGYGPWFCSAWNLLGVAILRLLVIGSVKTNGSRGLFLRARKLVPISTWIVTYLLMVPTLSNKYGTIDLECKTMACKMISVDEDGNTIPFGPEKFFSGIIVVIGIILIFLNIALYCQVRKKMEKFIVYGEEQNNARAKKWLEKERNIGKMMGTVTILYFLVYCLVVAVRLIYPNAAIEKPWLTATHYLIAWSIGFIDPVVYILWRKRYRDEIKRLLRRCYEAISLK